MRRLGISWVALGLVISCSSLAPLRELTEKEKGVLFIKDHVPSAKQCAYLGKIKFSQEDNGGHFGCALLSRQAHVLIIKAAGQGANLVVADFSKGDPGVRDLDSPNRCDYEAKGFKCPPETLKELKRFE